METLSYFSADIPSDGGYIIEIHEGLTDNKQKTDNYEHTNQISTYY